MKKAGYSGVTTYVKESYAPVSAEEGFSGTCSPLNTTATTYCLEELSLHHDEKELQELDSEGRVIITDHRLFVLLNVRKPRSTRFIARSISQMMRLKNDSILKCGFIGRSSEKCLIY